MTGRRKVIVRYSDCFKLSIVEEIEKNGLSIEDCRRKYGIGGSTTIQKWLKKYGKNHLLNKIVRVETINEIGELQALKKELKALKEAFAETALENKVYKTYFQILGQETGMSDEIKKKVRTRVIEVLSKEEKVSAICKSFGISRQAHYKAVKSFNRVAISEAIIIEMVQEIRRELPKIGGKKLYYMLSDKIHQVAKIGRDKFFMILNNNDLLIQRKRSYTRTTYSNHSFRKWTNLVKDVEVSAKNQVWVSDITYIRTLEGFRYLSLITDLYSRRIVGYSLSNSLSIEGCLEALKKALKGKKRSESLIHHSDRGVQYCCKEYVMLLQKENIQISMTQENHCYENAHAERINGILKQEFNLDVTFNNEQQALSVVRSAINTYNQKRPHYALNLKTPDQVYFQKVA